MKKRSVSNTLVVILAAFFPIFANAALPSPTVTPTDTPTNTLTSTPTATGTPEPVIIAQFTALATPYSTLDSSKQIIKVDGCEKSSVEFSYIYLTTLLNLYDNGTFVLGIDNRVPEIPKFSIRNPSQIMLTGIWSPIDKSGTKFRLNPDGNLAIGTGGWDYISRWIYDYACNSTNSKQTYAGLAKGSFKVVTAEINAKSTNLVSGTPVPMGSATLSLKFDGFAETVDSTPTPTRLPPTPTFTPTSAPTNTPLPGSTSTPIPTSTHTPLPTDTPNPSWTNTPTSTPSPTRTPVPYFVANGDKSISYELKAKGAWRPTPTITPTSTPLPPDQIWVFGTIASNGVLNDNPPTVQAVIAGVVHDCDSTMTSYDCGVLAKPVDNPTANDEINLLVSNYNRSSKDKCYNNAVTILSHNGNIVSAAPTPIANGTIYETTKFEWAVNQALLDLTGLVEAQLGFAKESYTDGSCPEITPTPTNTSTPTSTPTNTPTNTTTVAPTP